MTPKHESSCWCYKCQEDYYSPKVQVYQDGQVALYRIIESPDIQKEQDNEKKQTAEE